MAQLYPWGAQVPDASGVFRANFRTSLPGATGFSFTAPAGSFPANNYGLFDMAGNVSEWCQDRYVPLPAGGPFKPGVLRLLKGGSWIAGPRGRAPPPASLPRPSMPTAISASGWCASPNLDPYFLTWSHVILP